MGGIGDAIGEAILKMIILAVIAGFLLCGFIFWGIPAIWEWLKPYLHAWTA
jgi:hypothetical protein